MFSGKTEELIRRLKERTKVEIFNPPSILGIMMKWWSHNANEICSTVPAAANIAILAQGCDVVGIDEALF
jgi:thymidine kinase